MSGSSEAAAETTPTEAEKLAKKRRKAKQEARKDDAADRDRDERHDRFRRKKKQGRRKKQTVLKEPRTMKDKGRGKPPAAATLDQPDGNGKCFSYSAMCAYQITTGKTPDADRMLDDPKIKYRIGGSPNDSFKAMSGYGFTRGEGYKKDWRKNIDTAAEQGDPVAIGLSWKKGGRTGNHWVYFVGYDEHGNILARDQQNLDDNGEHKLITIGKDWSGSAAGGWEYEITTIGIGCASAEDAKKYG